jgi:hypothetical protein
MTNLLSGTPDPWEYPPYAADYVARASGRDVLYMLRTQIEEMTALVRSLKPQQVDYRYAPGKWTVRQIIGHLGDGERVFSYRALRFSRGDGTPLAGFDEDEYVAAAPSPRVPIEDLLAEFQNLRRSTIYLFQNLDEEALMRRGVANEQEATVRALAFMMAGHVDHHLEILRTRYLQPIRTAD